MSQPLTRQTDDVGQVRIFHLTHLDNLPSILEAGGLLSFHELQNRHIAPHSIALSKLQARREEIEIASVSSNLHDYVPWCFAARPPLLYTTYRGGMGDVKQWGIVHLLSTVGRVQEANLECLWYDGHPLTTLSDFHFDLAELPQSLDWPVLLDQQWSNTRDDPDRKRRRQAEFLIRGFAPWSLILGIAVQTEEAAQAVKDLLPADAPLKVRILPEWYY